MKLIQKNGINYQKTDKEKLFSTNVQGTFNLVNKANILVVGDVMLDKYIYGDTSRISPEAPVPVFSLVSEEIRLGGAANVALNLSNIGCNVSLMGFIGFDTESSKILKILELEKIDNKLKKIDFTFFRNISLKDIYKVITDANIQDTRKSFVLLWIIASFTVFIVIWASVSEINQVVRANGEVTPESQVHMIQTNLTGPIEAVNIKLGDKITEGDIIFTIARSNYHKAYLSAIEEVKNYSWIFKG